MLKARGVVLNTLLPGDSFGVATLFTESDRYVSDIRAVRPCRVLLMSAPILEELDGVAPCKIVKVDVDENRALALQYAVASIPTLLVFRNGQLVNRSVGLISREDVLKLVQA